MARILIVEDEPLIADFMARGLKVDGHTATVFGEGEPALAEIAANRPDVVLLDVMLPGDSDGFDVLKAIREHDKLIPVIMLTARGEIRDRVKGFDSGATDYLVKPFAFAELSARIRAHLRVGALAASEPEGTLSCGDLTLALIDRTVVADGIPVVLSTRELALLTFLVRNVGHALSRQQLLDGVWGDATDARSNVVDVYVGYLRRKLEAVDSTTQLETIRGIGYRLSPA